MAWSLIGRFVRREGDEPTRVNAKVMWIFTWAAMIVVAPGGLPAMSRGDYWSAGISVLCILYAGVCLTWLLVTKNLTPRFQGVAGVALILIICLLDMVSMTNASRSWSLFVIVMDILLVGDAPIWITQLCACVCCMWIFYSELELQYRLGMLDLPGMLPYEERRTYFCTCEHPPCGPERPISLLGYSAMFITIFVVDYRATRGFAFGMRTQKRKVDAAVDAARTIAGSLSQFDLETASQSLDESSSDLPEELRASLSRLLDNLRSYRPYLPQGLLDGDLLDEDGACGFDDYGEVASSEDTENHSVGTGDASTIQRSSTCLSAQGDGGSTADAASFTAVPLNAENRFNSTLTSVSGAQQQAPARALSNSDMSRSVTPLTPTLPPSAGFGDESKVRKLIYLRTDTVSVLYVRMSMPLADEPETFVARHSACVEDALQAVRQSRGVLSKFTGDVITATFNAFKRNVRHAESAMVAASAMDRAISPRCAACVCAVVTGVAGVGNLGTQTTMSPLVVGELPHAAARLALAGVRLNYSVLCTAPTARNVTFAIALRVSLHRVLGVRPDAAAGIDNRKASNPSRSTHRGPRRSSRWCVPSVPPQGISLAAATIYYVDNVAAGAAAGSTDSGFTCLSHRPTETGAAEWMYAMELEPGAQWAVYNDAGQAFLSRGPAAASEVLEKRHAPAWLIAAFDDAAAAALTLDLTPRTTKGVVVEDMSLARVLSAGAMRARSPESDIECREVEGCSLAAL